MSADTPNGSIGIRDERVVLRNSYKINNDLLSFLYSTAARPGDPVGSALSHDREQSEDVPQAHETAWKTLSPVNTGESHPALILCIVHSVPVVM